MLKYRAISRRAFLVIAASATVGCSAQRASSPNHAKASGGAADTKTNRTRKAAKKAIALAAPFVRPEEMWTAGYLFDFLHALPDEERLSLMKSLELVDKEADVRVLKGKDLDIEQITTQYLWISSNIMTYPFRNPDEIEYHEDVQWVAKKASIDELLVASASTFALERAILESLFADLWDKLTPAQRRELLQKIDPQGDLQNKAAIAAMSGAAALGVLSGSVAFAGFAFYTTMSVTISTVAGFMGLTLPFAAYSGASTLVAFLSGPAGWAVLAVAATAGVALAGRADVKKSTAFICQLHLLKVAALIEAGTAEHTVFGTNPSISARPKPIAQ